MASVSQPRGLRQAGDGDPSASARTAQPAAPILQHPSAAAAISFPDPIPGIIPFGSLSMISGASGVGKTALLAEWCRRFRDGRSICWKPTTIPAEIGIIVGDRKWADHKQWFAAVGFPEIKHYSLRDDNNFNWDSLHNRFDIPKILSTAVDKLQLPAGSLLVVDPISLFIPGNLNDYKTVAIGLAKLDKVLTQRRLTTLGIVHMAKQKGDKKDRYTRPQDRILGSSALLGFSDTPMYLLGPEDVDDGYYGFGWIPHHLPSETFQFTRHPDTGLFVPYAAPNEDEDLKHLYDHITEAMEGTRTKDIIVFASDQLQVSTRTVHSYLGKLEAAGKIKKVQRGVWRHITP